MNICTYYLVLGVLAGATAGMVLAVAWIRPHTNRFRAALEVLTEEVAETRRIIDSQHETIALQRQTIDRQEAAYRRQLLRWVERARGTVMGKDMEADLESLDTLRALRAGGSIDPDFG